MTKRIRSTSIANWDEVKDEKKSMALKTVLPIFKAIEDEGVGLTVGESWAIFNNNYPHLAEPKNEFQKLTSFLSVHGCIKELGKRPCKVLHFKSGKPKTTLYYKFLSNIPGPKKLSEKRRLNLLTTYCEHLQNLLNLNDIKFCKLDSFMANKSVGEVLFSKGENQ